MKKTVCLIGLLTISVLFTTIARAQKGKRSYTVSVATPERPKGQQDVLELRCAPIDTVKIAVIGVGNRGISAAHRLSYIPTAKITVLSDVKPEYVKRAQERLKKQGHTQAIEFTGAEDWKAICKRSDVDLVYVNTHWDLHAPIALEAMRNGKHVALEVPAALTMTECWDLINAAEKSRRHCIMLENCNYDFFEMATLNMAQKGLFGEIVHAEGAYIHDLRKLNFSPDYYWNQWRLKANTKEVGSLYPTHGIGPVAHVMNIHRGDRMTQLSCFATNQFGMTAYAEKQFGTDSPQANTEYHHGDMSTTVIRTQKGKTMMIQHDVTSPRPYSRLHTISGTKGFAQKYPNEGLAFEPDAHNFLNTNQKDSLLKAYEHPIVREIGEFAKTVGGHGGMDFIMDYRLIYCLNKGLPLDMDVYDAAEWSCLVPLSKLSVENNGAVVEVPDFTRGAWKRLTTVTYYK